MSSAIKLKCPSCTQPIRSADININKMAAKCSTCGCVFSFKPSLFRAYSIPLKSKKVKVPNGVKLHKQDKKMFLTYRWWNVRHLFWILIGGLWNIATILWFMITLANDAYFMAMLGAIYAIGGIIFLYSGIAGFLNETVIEVNEFQLSVTHNPIPWKTTPKLRRDLIDQLYCTLYINRGKHYTRYSYQLHAILKNNKHVCLLEGIENAEQARYLEHNIEKFAGIRDRYVHGEYVGK